jgi:hypothetical protein
MTSNCSGELPVGLQGYPQPDKFVIPGFSLASPDVTDVVSQGRGP